MNQPGKRTVSEELGLLVKETQAALHLRMDEALRPLGLSVPQYVCLQTLRDAPGITGSELARRTFVSRQALNVLLQGLERRGLVLRSDEPGPRRERAAVLTRAAAILVTRARAAVAVVVEDMTRTLEPARRDDLRAMLTACREALLRR